MIQGYDPRTGAPAGELVPETSDAEVDAMLLPDALREAPLPREA